ncbi:F0F1 ATP synthase subunit gamma [Arhodomonas aquaeolei]|uniref:F0F1 ATP synthase subunit gamma n=1 Tax=Arhodomonas TaxID=2368 RepID=UPI0013D015D2|nr:MULTISPECIES: F0F1 ATP synthase subunit gamma [Arhodomonas]MCS4503339.1 F0F1 ATP synthase subunit gamma [Arhodomonas aquaeolei]
MSGRARVEARIATLGELGEILGSMKTLAAVEARTLARLQTHQAGVSAVIDTASRAFWQHYGGTLLPDAGTPVTLAVGSERGFVGDFNRRVAAAVPAGAPCLTVGRRLPGRLPAGVPMVGALDGPVVADEVEPVLTATLAAFARFIEGLGPPRITAVYQVPGGVGVRHRQIFPPSPEPPAVHGAGNPPLLNLSPGDFLRELLDYHLTAALRDVVLSSLTAENEQRTQHLDVAVRRLDERRAALRRRGQALRQEEITEEIEVILLGETALAPLHRE